MHNDEQDILEVLTTWRAATADGEVEQVLTLMTDDVVFLRPGQPPMIGKEAFERELRAGVKHCCIQSNAKVKELKVVADMAYCWSALNVTAQPRTAGATMQLSGNVLTILQRQQDGRWLVTRDANMLTAAPAPAH